MTDWAAIITASTGVLTVSGGGIAFVWNKVEKGLHEVRTQLEECQKREAAHNTRAAAQLTVIELLWQEVDRRSRGDNPVLKRAGKLLDDLKEKERAK